MYKEILEKLDVLLAQQQQLLLTLLSVESNGQQPVDDWLDNTDVKQLLKISDSSLYRLRKNQMLPCKRIAGKWYYSRLTIAAIIQA